MSRHLLAFTLSLAVLGGASAADKPKYPVIRWYGQSFFQLESTKGTKIVFDPHLIENYGGARVSADLVLCSHRHSDHVQFEAIENAGKYKLVHGIVEKAKKAEWNLVDEKFKDISYRTVGVYHDEMMGMERGKNTVFCLDVDGQKIVFLGDLGHTLTKEQIKQIGPVDVLLIPVGGVYTINGADAKKVVEQLKPKKYIIPMHYAVPKVFEEVLPVDEFIEDQKNVKKYSGNRLELDPEVKDAPQIVILNYK
jgi:L-ascorbate metabolism protein UlaG (beta-lactamase superfamily)